MRLDLLKPDIAYFFGFVSGDGSLSTASRNRGKLSVELAGKDKSILVEFQKLFESVNSVLTTRTRDTNFKNNYTSVTLSFHDLGFRQALQKAGLLPGKKAATVKTPDVAFSEHDFYRGLIDADGAVGFAAGGWPFVSLNTSSDAMLGSFEEYLERTVGAVKNTNRNNRDNTYNVVVTREHAVSLCKQLYRPGCLALNRKQELANKVMKWSRPLTMKLAPPRKRWNEDEDNVVRLNTAEDAAVKLGRTAKSVLIRRWRLGL